MSRETILLFITGILIGILTRLVAESMMKGKKK